jgi:hypothetical protein
MSGSTPIHGHDSYPASGRIFSGTPYPTTSTTYHESKYSGLSTTTRYVIFAFARDRQKLLFNYRFQRFGKYTAEAQSYHPSSLSASTTNCSCHSSALVGSRAMYNNTGYHTFPITTLISHLEARSQCRHPRCTSKNSGVFESYSPTETIQILQSEHHHDVVGWRICLAVQ